MIAMGKPAGMCVCMMKLDGVSMIVGASRGSMRQSLRQSSSSASECLQSSQIIMSP